MAVDDLIDVFVGERGPKSVFFLPMRRVTAGMGAFAGGFCRMGRPTPAGDQTTVPTP